MEKLEQLRQRLRSALPALARDRDRLKIYVDKGRMAARLTDALGYEWRYRARLLFTELSIEETRPDAVMVPLMLWLREHQPDRLLDFARGDEAVSFSAEILDDTSYDLLIEFELSDAVQVTPRPGGGWTVEHLAEPPVGDALLGNGAALTDLRLGDEPLFG